MNFPDKSSRIYSGTCSNIMMEHGTTITMERKNNPQSEYLHKASQSLRSFEELFNMP